MTQRTGDEYWREVIDPGDRASKLGHQICVDSYGNAPSLTVVPDEPENFRGPVGYVWRSNVLAAMMQNGLERGTDFWIMREDKCCDGAGGKPGFFTLRGDAEGFRDLGWEIITMTADDMARRGRLPVIMTNQPDIKRVTDQNFHLVEALFSGYGDALSISRLVNIAGETAIMKHSITSFCDTGSEEELVLVWSSTCTGLCHKDLMVDPSRIKPGMPIVGFAERGYRCNGGTFFTNTLLDAYGSVQGIRENEDAMRLVRQLTVPSQSYARTICRLIGWQDDGSVGGLEARICGIAHITGGGIWGKFGEILPEGVGAVLDAMPAPAKALLAAQELSKRHSAKPLSDWQAHSTLHGGCGMLFVAYNDYDAQKIINAAPATTRAGIVGHTVKSPAGLIRIKSQFLDRPGKELRSDRPF
jgi:phosphoribosylaminoimidazole (AIR) synthetase